MRVDKWIWAVRMVKSRTLAGSLCKSGKVKVNGEMVKPSKNIKLEDIVEVTQKKVVKIYKVIGFLEKRTSATIAAKNFEDFSPSPEEEYFGTSQKKIAQRDPGAGRPTKKEYRTMKKFRWKE